MLFVRLLAFVLAWFSLPGFAAEATRNLAVGAAGTEKRVALVIGNGNYPSAPLRNPANDARDMAAALARLGFDVIARTDVTQKEMNRAIAQFGAKLSADSVALFFYAGHGMQVRGKNYLIPIDADIESESGVRAETVDVDTVLDQLGASGVNLVVLDACRNNPFERRFRALGGGLAQMDAPKGTLIGYATSPGRVASDGGGRNGIYTAELLKLMQTPGIPVEQVFKRVRANVARATGDNQIPWEASSLTGDFYFIPPKAEKASDAQSARLSELENALREQRDSKDRAVEEALRRAGEQAARERAEMQKQMERLLQEALARQAAQIEKERGSSAVATAPAAPARRDDSGPTERPIQTALMRPTQTPTLDKPLEQIAGSPRAGDEWEYRTVDRLFGVKHSIIQRVKGVVAGTGVLEDYVIDGKTTNQLAYAGKPLISGLPIESELMFGPHWAGAQSGSADLIGVPRCTGVSCQASISLMGQETITVPAGRFETDKYRVAVNFQSIQPQTSGQIQLTVWYSPSDRRVIRQHARATGFLSMVKMDETVELIAIRTEQH